MSCQKKTVKDVMREMRAKARRQLTPAEREIARVSASQSTEYVCKPARGLHGAAARPRRAKAKRTAKV